MFGNFNKIMLLGRLVADPETRTFTNGGKVAKFTIVVNERRKVGDEWEDNPMFVDCKIFNRGEYGKQADNVEKYLHKGSITFVEGKLTQEKWESQDGQKRSKHVVLLDSFQVLDSREERQQSQQKEPEKHDLDPAPPDEDVPF